MDVRKASLHVLESIIGIIILISAVSFVKSLTLNHFFSTEKACYGNDGNLYIQRYLLSGNGSAYYHFTKNYVVIYEGSSYLPSNGIISAGSIFLHFYENNSFFYSCSSDLCLIHVLSYTDKTSSGWQGTAYYNNTFGVSNYEQA